MCIPLSLLGNGSVKKKRYRGNEYTSNNRRIVGPVVFYDVRVLSKESRRIVLSRTSCYICIIAELTSDSWYKCGKKLYPPVPAKIPLRATGLLLLTQNEDVSCLYCEQKLLLSFRSPEKCHADLK
jgi:hypothetical protein